MSIIFGRKKFTFVPQSENDFILSIKGLALLDAIETGLVRETPDGNGYDIGPFLNFWNRMLPLFPDSFKERPGEIEQIMEVLKKQRNQGTDD